MLVAEFQWLLEKLPTGDPVRVRIETAYGAEIKSAKSPGKTIDLFVVDRHLFSGPLKSTGCPRFHADRRFPFPPGSLVNMPTPLLGESSIRIEGKGKSSFIPTTAPPHDRPSQKRTPGDNFDIAAARTFQQRPEGANASLEDIAWVTEAFRPNEKQLSEAEARSRSGREGVKRAKDKTYPHHMGLCTHKELEELQAWLNSDCEVKMMTGRSLSPTDMHGLGRGAGDASTRPLTENVVDAFMEILRRYMATKEATRRMFLMNAESTLRNEQEQEQAQAQAQHDAGDAADDEERTWLGRARGHGATPLTFDLFHAMIVPVQLGGHFALVVAELPAREEPCIYVWKPDAPQCGGDVRTMAEVWLRKLSDVHFAGRLMADPYPHDWEVGGLLVCYYAALYVARQETIELKYIDRDTLDAIREWVASTIKKQWLEEESMARLRTPNAVQQADADADADGTQGDVAMEG